MKKFNISNYDINKLMEFINTKKIVYFLDSSCESKWSRYSIIAFNPFFNISANKSETTIIKKNRKRKLRGNPLTILEKIINKYSIDTSLDNPFQGGAIGYINYEASQFISEFKHIKFNKEKQKSSFPLMFFSFFDDFILIDKKTNMKWFIIAEIRKEERNCPFNIFKSEFEKFQSKLKEKRKNYTVKSKVTWERYKENISSIKEWIRQGDIYQANYTIPFSIKKEWDSLSIYQQLRKESPAPYSCFLKAPFGEILSSSPEKLLPVNMTSLNTPLAISMDNGYSFDSVVPGVFTYYNTLALKSIAPAAVVEDTSRIRQAHTRIKNISFFSH